MSTLITEDVAPHCYGCVANFSNHDDPSVCVPCPEGTGGDNCASVTGCATNNVGDIWSPGRGFGCKLCNLGFKPVGERSDTLYTTTYDKCVQEGSTFPTIPVVASVVCVGSLAGAALWYRRRSAAAAATRSVPAQGVTMKEAEPTGSHAGDKGVLGMELAGASEMI